MGDKVDSKELGASGVGPKNGVIESGQRSERKGEESGTVTVG